LRSAVRIIFKNWVFKKKTLGGTGLMWIRVGKSGGSFWIRINELLGGKCGKFLQLLLSFQGRHSPIQLFYIISFFTIFFALFYGRLYLTSFFLFIYLFIYLYVFYYKVRVWNRALTLDRTQFPRIPWQGIGGVIFLVAVSVFMHTGAETHFESRNSEKRPLRPLRAHRTIGKVYFL
jgi:hypothetical protein